MASCVLLLLSCLVLAWDVLTFPLYLLLQRPWARRSRMRRRRAEVVASSDQQLTLRALPIHCPIKEELAAGAGSEAGAIFAHHLSLLLEFQCSVLFHILIYE